MLKKDELATPTSCINKAADDEPVFVLRANDPIAPHVVRYWAVLSARWGLHNGSNLQAVEEARNMDVWRAEHHMKVMSDSELS